MPKPPASIVGSSLSDLAPPRWLTTSVVRVGGPESENQLVTRYRRRLRDYLQDHDPKGLRAARELGGLAMTSGLGMFDLARLHEGAMAGVITVDDCTLPPSRQIRAADAFLLDALAPFAAARRGLPEAYGQLDELNHTLQQRTAALGSLVAQQHRTADALRASRTRYSQLFRQANSLKEHIRRKSAEVILAKEEERKRISRELHDEIGQTLAAVNIALMVLRKRAGRNRGFQARLASTQALLEQSMASVHRFAQKLRPEILELFGPFEAIRSYVRAFAERTGIEATVQDGVDLDGLNADQGATLFRVVQESITNISKHAKASRVEVRFRRHDQGICMEIEDNGRAFSVADQLGRNGGHRLGLVGMQERVRLVRGKFSIESAQGKGTKVRVRIPLGPEPRRPVNGHGAIVTRKISL